MSDAFVGLLLIIRKCMVQTANYHKFLASVRAVLIDDRSLKEFVPCSYVQWLKVQNQIFPLGSDTSNKIWK
jgi:hypothetical protein